MCDVPAALAAPETRSPVRQSVGLALRAIIVRIIATLHQWQERARQRQALRELDERMLRDIGLTPSDVDRETRKPFWMP